MAFNNSDFDGRAIQAPLPDVAGLPLRREVRGDLHILARDVRFGVDAPSVRPGLDA